ncbi:long-chain-alcohol oxidase FAO2-like, partial [Nymphaea colorata]
CRIPGKERERERERERRRDGQRGETDETRSPPTAFGGKKEKYSHGYSASQMKSLSAICATFIRPVSMSETSPHVAGEADPASKHLREFYEASGSDNGVPEEVAEIMVRRLPKEGVVLMWWLLWALSTKVGTLVLCGRESLSWRFPFVRSFPDMPVEARERVLQRWTKVHGPFFFLRMAFGTLKIFCFHTFYSQVDEDVKNRFWTTVGYDVPQDRGEATRERPLDKGVVDTSAKDGSSLLKSLSNHGLRVAEDHRRNLYTIECDAVVVGSGCGGSIAAALLAKSGYKVVVMEKGGYFWGDDYSLLEGPSMEEMYQNGAKLATLDSKIMIMAGSTVGGGSAINWSASIKTPEPVRREWANDHGLALFGRQEYQEAMDVVWRRLGVVDKCLEEGLQNKVLRAGCESLGLDCESVPTNSSEAHYCGQCSYGCPTGDKKGADSTWLVDAVNCGAVILTRLKAEKFVFEERNEDGGSKKKRCVGVLARVCEPRNSNSTRRVLIRAKLSVSAGGALLTPPLLISSGLKNPNIGRHLHLHPVLLAWGYFPESDSSFKGKSFEGGIITSIHKLLSEQKSPKIIIEAAALGPATYAALTPWVSAVDMKEKILRYSRTVHLFALARDVGSGEVKEEDRVTYKFHQVDKENLTDGLRTVLRIMVAAGASEVGTLQSDGQRLKAKGIKKEDLDEFLDVVVARGGMASRSELWTMYCSAHQMGSCRMGVNEEEGAVDENGHSWEADGLFVCDGSLLPTAVGVNPMITIQSAAYCVSNRMIEYLNSKSESRAA